MNLSKLSEILKNQPQYRFKQVEEAIYREFIGAWSEVTTLPLPLRQELEKNCPLSINGEIIKSGDGKTVKALITLSDGKKIESVLLSHGNRHTVCVSSQVGCPLGCGFCATGQMGFSRNLTVPEIVGQVLFFARHLKTNAPTESRVSNVVFMGMGEPFLNYDSIMSAIRLINDKDKFNIGARKISVSTVGIIEGINKFAKENIQVNLALSLHAPNDKLRAQLMPINKKYPLKKVIAAVDNYIDKTSRRVMIEYLMIAGVNDSAKCAQELADLIQGKLYVVNLITCNPVGKFKPSNALTIQKFHNALDKLGVPTTQRYKFGREINAACGQLAGKNNVND